MPSAHATGVAKAPVTPSPNEVGGVSEDRTRVVAGLQSAV
jgi:hypothetical protein